MDTKTLKVGQYVHLRSGCYGASGTVVKVTPDGADVQTGVKQIGGTWNAHELLHFDNSGKGCNDEGTRECGPWHIVEFDG
jgi:hypothetical protein